MNKKQIEKRIKSINNIFKDEKMKIKNRELQEFNNKDYKYFVCDIYHDLRILSGWEYKEDAKDSLIDTKEDAENCYYNVDLKVYTRRHLENLLKWSNNLK